MSARQGKRNWSPAARDRPAILAVLCILTLLLYATLNTGATSLHASLTVLGNTTNTTTTVQPPANPIVNTPGGSPGISTTISEAAQNATLQSNTPNSVTTRRINPLVAPAASSASTIPQNSRATTTVQSKQLNPSSAGVWQVIMHNIALTIILVMLAIIALEIVLSRLRKREEPGV